MRSVVTTICKSAPSGEALANVVFSAFRLLFADMPPERAFFDTARNSLTSMARSFGMSAAPLEPDAMLLAKSLNFSA